MAGYSTTDYDVQSWNSTLSARKVDQVGTQTLCGTVAISAAGSLPVSAGGSLPVSAGGSLPTCADGTLGVSCSNSLPVSASTGLDTGLEAFTTMSSAMVSSVAASTAYQLASYTCKSVALHADDDNTNQVYIGASTVTATGAATDGYRLNKGQGVSLRVSNINKIYFATKTAADKLYWIAVV